MRRLDLLLPRAGPRSIVDPTADRTRDADAGKARSGALGGPSFDDILSGTLGGNVKLSAHAQQRLQSRGIELGPVELDRISQAIDLLAQKGGKESLLLSDRAAFVVSVPNRTVITAVARDELKDNVFTQIDSALLLD
ncbi:MAG: hypothetical protein H6704_08785 [Myxococcales bacterium]|nr:hypothetical protein [Myxococcales bacterium]MCB9536347.1 hypothetical protein [Myxococcales bacterium]